MPIIWSRISYVSLNQGSTRWLADFSFLYVRLLILFQAMKQANVTDPLKCYFVDDNRENVDAAREQGWPHCVHFCEKGLETMEGGWIKDIDNTGEPGSVDNDVIHVTTLDGLRLVWPEIFKSTSSCSYN